MMTTWAPYNVAALFASRAAYIIISRSHVVTLLQYMFLYQDFSTPFWRYQPFFGNSKKTTGRKKIERITEANMRVFNICRRWCYKVCIVIPCSAFPFSPSTMMPRELYSNRHSHKTLNLNPCYIRIILGNFSEDKILFRIWFLQRNFSLKARDILLCVLYIEILGGFEKVRERRQSWSCV